MKKLLFRNIVAIVLYGTVSHCAFSSSLSSPIETDTLSLEQKQKVLMSRLAAKAPEEKGAASETVISPALVGATTSTSEAIPLHKKQGNMSGVSAAKVKQTYKSSAAKESVEQGNIDGSTIEGDIEQDFN